MSYNRLYEFEKNAEGFTLKRFAAVNDSGVTEADIPSVYEGLPVLRIGFEAFAWARFLRSVVIPESIRVLGGGAFRECTALESARVPGGIRQLSSAAFFRCAALKTAELCEGVEIIGANAFRECASLENVILPKGLRSIESCAFLESPKLPAEIVLMGLAGSVDKTAPFKHFFVLDWESVLRLDVFKLALKYGSLGNNRGPVLCEIVKRGLTERLALAEQAGWLDDAKTAGALANLAAAHKKAETAAWLLDLINRKFGFSEGDYEL